MFTPPTTKTTTTSRGYKYTYLHSPAQPGKPTLLLIHGFPSTAHDWRFQIPYFTAKGYGIIAPDMLAYGETDKPAEPEAYVGSKLARDLVDIVQHENAERVIAVGHDWGALPTTYLAALHQDRFAGFVFLAVGFQLTRGFDFEKVTAHLKQICGTEIYGYWDFFNKEDAAGIIEKNLDSLLDLLYVKEHELWKTILNPLGAIDTFISEGKRTAAAEYLTEEDRSILRTSLSKGGLTAPLNYYKATYRGLQDTDNLGALTNVKVKKPVFYLGGTRDYVCRLEMQEPDLKKYCEDVRIEVLETGHWVHMEAAERVNATIEGWAGEKGLLNV
ncbi:Alpha/Beta hydrolase protein [Schizophyllum commune]